MFCLEVFLSLIPKRKMAPSLLPADARVAVLIPAHNEESVIGPTLNTLLPTLPPGSRVVVVADNCTDQTATIARDCGADIVERVDAARRGKGYALDHGIRHLNAAPPHVVVFLDADCRVAPQTVALLAGAAHSAQRPIQGLNLCDPDPRGGGGQLASGLAFRFKNLVRTLGLVRLAGLCHLTGTGMALPWPLIENVKLAGANVVEDMQLGIDLALAGKPPVFLPTARVTSPLPQKAAAVRSQRTRWEHGHLKTLLHQTPRLLALAARYRRRDVACLALDLAIPPLALLTTLLAAFTCLAAAAWLTGLSSWPFILATAALASLLASVFLGWTVHCRQAIPFRALAAAPFYALSKLPIYLAFVRRPQRQWIRTERDPASA
jgi:cellulose synthase/poly-beta-1,6-N-acetylglucosamine synthase-like glycosyltransferase